MLHPEMKTGNGLGDALQQEGTVPFIYIYICLIFLDSQIADKRLLGGRIQQFNADGNLMKTD